MEQIGIFTPTPLPAPIDIEQIVTLHYFRYTKEFAFSGERHDFWEMAYVDRGQVGVVAENQGYSLRQGEAIFHRPGEYHNIWADNQYANVVILTFVCHSPAMAFFENKIIPFTEEHQALLAHILKAGEQCFQGPRDNVDETGLILLATLPFGGLQVIKNYMELLLISLVQTQEVFSRQNRASSTVKRQGDSQIAEAIQKILLDHIYGNLTLEDIQKQICFSKSYITRLFRSCTGQSVMGWYLEQKMAQAQRLISEGAYTFTEIAQLLHFNSVHHFSSSFKKNVGMTPTEYMQSVQSKAVL